MKSYPSTLHRVPFMYKLFDWQDFKHVLSHGIRSCVLVEYLSFASRCSCGPLRRHAMTRRPRRRFVVHVEYLAHGLSASLLQSGRSRIDMTLPK